MLTQPKMNGAKIITIDEIAQKKKPICAFRGCPWHGIYKPILLMRAEANSPPLKVELDVVVCGIHTRNVGPEEYLSDKGWEIVCGILPPGTIRPDRKLTTLEFELAI